MPVETNFSPKQLEAMARKRILHTFPPAVLRQASAIAVSARELDRRPRVKGYSIDPPDAKEKDDALWVEKEGAGFRAVVSIADPSALIPLGSEIDLEARKRASSLYLGKHFIPLFPQEIAAKADLAPNKDRLVLAVEMRFDGEGNCRGIKPFEAVLKSEAALTYSEAAANMCFGHSLSENLKTAFDLAILLFKQRKTHQAFAFYDDASALLSDEEGSPTALDGEKPYSSYLTVQELMIATNRAIAAYLVEHGAPFLFRVHEARPSTPARSTAIQTLSRYAGLGRVDMLASLLDTYLQRARYSTVNVGHYGLALGAYAHFTSPLRRYVDLTLHRTLRQLLSGGTFDTASFSEQARWLEPIGKHCSEYPPQASTDLQVILFGRRDDSPLPPVIIRRGIPLPDELRAALAHPESLDCPKMAALILAARSSLEARTFLDAFFDAFKNFDYVSTMKLLTDKLAIGAPAFSLPDRLGVRGPEHQKEFGRRLEALVEKSVLTTRELGIASSIKRAEQRAAFLFLRDYVASRLIVPEEVDNTAWQKPAIAAPAAGPAAPATDYRSLVNLFAQKKGLELPVVATSGNIGTLVQPRFETTITLNLRRENLQGIGSGGNKKSAEQAAAKNLWEQLETRGIAKSPSAASAAPTQKKHYGGIPLARLNVFLVDHPEIHSDCQIAETENGFRATYTLTFATGGTITASGTGKRHQLAKNDAASRIWEQLSSRGLV